jgi:hypothetical protein
MISYLEKKINQIVKWWKDKELKKKILDYKNKLQHGKERDRNE